VVLRTLGAGDTNEFLLLAMGMAREEFSTIRPGPGSGGEPMGFQ
jgi:hypothetical protein